MNRYPLTHLCPKAINIFIMITVTVEECNSFSQDYYDSIVFSLQIHQLTCSCGHSGCLTLHAYYKRKVKPPDGSEVILRITRVKCSEWGATHAILLSSIVPYSQISLSVQQIIVDAYESDDDTLSVCTDTGTIDENNVKSVIRRYLRHWQQRLLSFRIVLSPIRLLVERCFSFYSVQFMQIRRTFNTLFATPT